MNLNELIGKLKQAVEQRRWFDVARLAGDAIKAGADLGEMLFGGMTGAAVEAVDDTALGELSAAVAVAKAEPATTGATAGAIDPATVLTIVSLVIDLIRAWRAKK